LFEAWQLVADVVQSHLPWLNQRVQPPLPCILPQDQTIHRVQRIDLVVSFPGKELGIV